MEQRLVEIELKLVSLEDTVQSLNQQLYEQGRQLDEMRTLCKLLIRRLEDSGSQTGGFSPSDERPPHY